MEDWWVYIIDKERRLYVGITTNLRNRMRQHGMTSLLYQEGPISRVNAVKREKQLKGWSRKKKFDLIARASSRER